MIKPSPKLWGAVLTICFCCVCNVHAAGQKDLESSFLRDVQEFLTGINEINMEQKAHPEKTVKYDEIRGIDKDTTLSTMKYLTPDVAERYAREAESIKPWTAHYSIISDQFTYDIQATNSIISPYVGIVTFHTQYWEKEGNTKEECLSAPWKLSHHLRDTWKFSYQNGKWTPYGKPYVEIGE